MKISRLFAIVYLLLENKTMTAAALGARLEVSRRTILRDIEALSLAGVPIYTTQGKGGGIKLLDQFVLSKMAVSETEQSQILLALQSLEAAGNLPNQDLLIRLGALFEKTDENWIEVDFSRWGIKSQDQEKFALLKRALIEAQGVVFWYEGTDQQSAQERTVYPLKLVFKGKAWYLQAYCTSRMAYRIFKLNRMTRLSLAPCFFKRDEYTPPKIETEVPSEAMVKLTLLFASEAASRVYDEFDSEVICKNIDGSLRVVTSLPEDGWLYGFLLSFGQSVKVISPRHVSERLLSEIEAIKNLYKNT